MSKFTYEIPLQEEKTLDYRLLEIFPGMLSWLVLAAPVLLAFISPLVSASFIILYMVGWMVKAFVMIVRVIQGYKRVEQYSSLDWYSYLSDFDNYSSKAVLEKAASHDNAKFDVMHYNNLIEFSKFKNKVLPKDVLHAVVFPIYNEGMETLEPSMKALADSEYDLTKIWLYIAFEERGGTQVERDVVKLAKQYKNVFGKIVPIQHPDGMPNEVKGKGGNIYYAGQQMLKDIEDANISPNRVTVTTLDADNRVHRKYFNSLTYHFVITEHKTSISYQPIPLYTNNIWDVPAPVRVAATGNSFYQVIQSTRPHLMRNFSSHAQSLEGLLKTDLWSVRTVVEDGHQYWRSFIALKGEYDVIPIFVPIYQDAVLADDLKSTMKAQFVQRRRWAYGCSDIPYLISWWWKERRKLPFFKTWTRIIRLLESHVSLATASLVLALGGWGPWIVNHLSDGNSAVALRMPGYAQFLRYLGLIGFPISIYLGWKILPPRPERYLKRRSLWMILQWAWLPVSALLFGSFAALNAQTRLMLGKYLEVFDVTEKVVKKD